MSTSLAQPVSESVQTLSWSDGPLLSLSNLVICIYIKALSLSLSFSFYSPPSFSFSLSLSLSLSLPVYLSVSIFLAFLCFSHLSSAVASFRLSLSQGASLLPLPIGRSIWPSQCARAADICRYKRVNQTEKKNCKKNTKKPQLKKKN